MPNKDNLQKLMKFIKADDWAVPSKDDDLDEASEETRRNWAKGKEAGRGFQRFGPIDPSKEKGSLENPRDVMGHWRDEGVTRKRNVASPWGGMPRQFPVQQEGGISGPVTGATYRYGKREDYDTSNASQWEEVKPSSARERARMGMENSLQKIGYTTSPKPFQVDAPEIEDIGGREWDEQGGERGMGELHPQWEGASEAVKKIGRGMWNQSFGLPPLDSKEHEKIRTIMRNAGQPDNLHNAHAYLETIQNPYTTDEDVIEGERFDHVPSMHLKGHKALATAHNVMNFGEDYLHHPDAIRYKDNPGVSSTGVPWDSFKRHERLWELPIADYHDKFADHLDRDNMSEKGLAMAEVLHRRLRMSSPDYTPDESEKSSVTKLQKFLRKEGEGGGAFNGLSDTVFTSTNAGIFTPTFGGRGNEKKHRKNEHRQDKKRKKLMGKDKKSGVERLVQFLYEGSPHISKAKKMGLAPGLDDSMTGDGATAHAWNNQATGRMRLNWKKDVTEDTLNHKRTSRPLEDALKTAENNEPHVNMGLPGGMETGITATVPVRHSNVNSVGNPPNPRGPDWGKHKSYVQKSANEATTMTSPTENKPWSLDEPQDKFVERAGDNPNEPPAKDAVIKENDMQRRVKKYDNKEDEGNEPYQAEGAMAVAGMGGYPSGATMQMSSFGMNTYEQDALARTGDKDMEDPEISQEESDLLWVPEAEKVAKLEAMRKMLEAEGDETPLMSALFALDGE